MQNPHPRKRKGPVSNSKGLRLREGDLGLTQGTIHPWTSMPTPQMPRVMVTSGAQDTTQNEKGKPGVAVVVEACGQ